MKTNPAIEFTLSYELPSDFFKEFEEDLNKGQINVITTYAEESEYYNFTGSEIVDVLIAIKENPASIFLFPALYDIAKSVIIGIWNKLKGVKEEKGEAKSITIRYTDNQNRVVDIKLEGDIDDKTIDKAVSGIEKLISDKDTFFQNPEFVRVERDKPETIELYFNTQSGVWEPVNFEQLRRDMEEFQRRAEEDFDS